MKHNLDSEILAFIDKYHQLSGQSTSPNIKQQRSDNEIIVKHFSYPHPPGVVIRDSVVTGRHGDIPLR